MKSLLKKAIATTPYRIVRDFGANRFEAAETCLRLMRNRGFKPTVIIDGGANAGTFSLMAQGVFPAAKFHLIEPQPSCTGVLSGLCGTHGWTLHACAISDRSGRAHLRISQDMDTGAYVDSDGVEIAVDTLDRIFGDGLRDETTFLKLDLQGHELHALRGAEKLLPTIDVVFTEVAFFSQASPPTIAELVVFMAEHGFHLHDVAALHGRMRDNRLHGGDFVFVRNEAALAVDDSWA